MKAYELNMDGLVGPTHNYAGLSFGNLASTDNAQSTSNPQASALQGIAKMRFMHELGLKQALLPPHQRPNLSLLWQLGFTGTHTQQISKAAKQAPHLLAASYSASAMWTANAATVSPSNDSLDSKVHFTAANLIANLHRQQEAHFTSQILQHLFADPNYFVHHQPIPCSFLTADEGAANHNRLCLSHGQPGLQLFVYGRKDSHTSNKYPARQTYEASAAIARNHVLAPDKVLFACQNSKAIDQGIFHNDVIAVANERVLLLHEETFSQQDQVINALLSQADFPLQIIQIGHKQVSVAEALASYLFNSQLVSLPNSEKMLLVAPQECQTHSRVQECITNLLADSANSIQAVHYFDLKQSMRNGGGPACLRLRVVLNERELQAMHQGVLLTTHTLDTLDAWVKKHYRCELKQQDLADPSLMDESLRALDELTQILHLGSIYPFQNERTA